MRTLRNRFIGGTKLLPVLLAFAWTMTSCDTSEIADCFEGFRLRVVVDSSESQTDPNWLGEGEMEDVMLYVFDENEILIDMFPTEVGKVELLYYPDAETLHVVSTANVDRQKLQVTELTPGVTRLQQAEITLLRCTDYLEHDCYDHPTDIFSGKLSAQNVDYNGIIDLPIRRKTAAVMVRVKGMRDYLKAYDAADDDFRVVLSTKYNRMDFNGNCSAVRADNDYPVSYELTGLSRTMYEKEYFEFPGQLSHDKTDYIRTISTDEGSAVSVYIYHKDRLITENPITQHADGTPILVKNDLLHVILIEFGQGGEGDYGKITIRVKEASWNDVVPIEKEFGN